MTDNKSAKQVLLIAPLKGHWQQVRDWLASFGCNVTEAFSCANGRKILDDDVSIDLVVLDAGSAEDSEIEFMEWKNKDPLLRPIPVIIGGYAFTERQLLQYTNLQVNDVILLPTDRDRLKAKFLFAVENGRFTALVVDDEEGIRDVLSFMLKIHRYQVYEASSVDEALKVFNSKKIDVIVSDILMPGKTGFDLLVEVKKRRPDIPVIFITGYGGRFTPDEAIAHGADAYLKKPFNSQELFYTLMRALAPKAKYARAGMI